MREEYRFQIRPDYHSLVHALLAVGTYSSMKGPVLIGEVGDENYRRIRELQKKLQERNGQELLAGWEINRSYSTEEIDDAELFLIRIPFTHLAAEEYGTKYVEEGYLHSERGQDRLKEDPELRAGLGKVPTKGIEQTGLLRLPVSQLSTRKDLIRIWGGEMIVSKRFAALVQQSAFTGGVLFPVLNTRGESTSLFLSLSDFPAGTKLTSIAEAKGMKPNELQFWHWLYSSASRSLVNELAEQQKVYRERNSIARSSRTQFAQLVVQSHPLETSGESCFGDNPFDVQLSDRQESISDEIVGNRLVSPLSVLKASWDASDFCQTQELVTRRFGLFRPHPLLVVSKGVLQSMIRERMKGFDFEVVNLV
jgi:hypothetical protein